MLSRTQQAKQLKIELIVNRKHSWSKMEGGALNKMASQFFPGSEEQSESATSEMSKGLRNAHLVKEANIYDIKTQ